MMAMPTPVIINRLELGIMPHRWPFAEARREEIDVYFAARRRAVPDLWNGRVLLMNEVAVAGDLLRGTFFETGFADFMAWRDWGFPDRSVVNCFGMAALRASDGAYLLGVMSAFTANPGRIYFPAGTPDPSDISGASVDLLGNLLRELGEETGLGAEDFPAAPGWTAIIAGPRIALMKEVAARRPAQELRAAVLRHLATEARPELADMRIVRSPADFDPAMPEFVTAYMSHVWCNEGVRQSNGPFPDS
jgi:8-oxo-dGTP pyrophosphatase MutT (NUDIX family)